MIFLRCTVVALMLAGAACGPADKVGYSSRHYAPDDERVRVTGRVTRADSIGIFWPGTSVLTRFSGSELRVHLRDELGRSYFNVVIDGDSVRHIKLDSGKHYYTLAAGLRPGEHTVELIRRNEWDKGASWLLGFQVTGGELVALPPRKKRILEFFGDSITAGYAIEDNSGGDSPDSTYTNNYKTYAAITARHFGADLYCTVKSGIGITISWFPAIMPEIYDRVDPEDSLSRWDFAGVQPDVVVINLFQNDSWLVKMPDYPTFRARFGTTPPTPGELISAYRDFVVKVRSAYPRAHIVCAIGSMDAAKTGSPWPGYVEKAVRSLRDQRMTTLVFPFTGKEGHPRSDDNAAMAERLIRHLEEHVSW